MNSPDVHSRQDIATGCIFITRASSPLKIEQTVMSGSFKSTIASKPANTHA